MGKLEKALRTPTQSNSTMSTATLGGSKGSSAAFQNSREKGSKGSLPHSKGFLSSNSTGGSGMGTIPRRKPHSMVPSGAGKKKSNFPGYQSSSSEEELDRSGK